jgi:hypothetical protein
VGSLLLRRAGIGAALGLAVGLSFFLPAIPLLLDVQASLADGARAMVVGPTAIFALLAVLLTAALVSVRGVPWRIAAAIVAIVAARSITLNFITPYTSVGWFEMQRVGPGPGLFMMWHVFAMAVLFACYHVQAERDRGLAQQLRGAQLERQRVERSMLESRLNVLRARVDPTFLFESLSEVRRAYGRSLAEGERLLDDLIGFLRASLPQARERGSTLGGEIHLAAAYLNVVSALRGRPFRLQVDMPEALSRSFFPPMVMMSLVDSAVRRTRTDSIRETAIRVHGSLDQGRARVVLDDGAGPDAAVPDLEALHATLRAFMGDARLMARSDTAGCSVTLEFPAGGHDPARKEVA